VDVESRLDAKGRVVRGAIYLVAMLAVCLTFTAITETVLEDIHTGRAAAL
jgi:hypothetical protein